MEKYILETKGLTKTFKEQIAVNHLDLKVEKTPFTDCLGQMARENRRL